MISKNTESSSESSSDSESSSSESENPTPQGKKSKRRAKDGSDSSSTSTDSEELALFTYLEQVVHHRNLRKIGTKLISGHKLKDEKMFEKLKERKRKK